MKLSKNILIITALLFSTQINATVYEDAEDKSTSRWQVYDNTPIGAKVNNVYIENRDHNAIKFIGSSTNNGYILGNWENRDGAWDNTNEQTLKWSMNFDEGYTVYVRVMSKDGARYIYYTPSDKSYGKRNNEYIHIGLGSKSNDGTWQDFSRNLASDLKKYEPNNELIAVNAFLVRGSGMVDDVELVGEEGNSNILHGGKLDNSGEGSYYKWDDADAVRGLVFDAHQDFTLKSVKVYNQEGQASTRVFTLYNVSGNVVASESVYVKEGEQRIALNMQVPKGNGYKLMADIHKGLYKNNNATGYPYKIGNTVSITSSDLKNSHYYFFYDWEVVVDTAIPEPTPNPNPVIKTKAYIPNLDFSKNDVYGNGNIINVSTVSELSHAIQNASSKTTIVLKDGVYGNVSIRVPAGINNITIKAEHTHKAIIIPRGKEGHSMLYFARAVTQKDAIHHVNIIGLLIRGSDDKHRQFIKSEGGGAYSVHHIYLEKLKIHDLFMGIYSGLHSHDWTVNNCEMYNSRYSHMWYMMGWHQAVINSKFYNGSHDIIAIRGYYPEGERYYGAWSDDPQVYQRQLDEQKKYNPLTESRTNRKGFIERSNWTHLIDNNQFLSWDMKTPQRSNWNTHLGIAYGNYDNLPYGAENVYLPPQNITITNNTFSNIGEHPEAHINAIKLDAKKGIENNSPASINGITIHNNKFTAVKDDEKFIVRGDGNPNLDKIDSKNNTRKIK